MITPPATIQVTVAVCTRDRPDQLRTLLRSVCDLAIPTGLTWELLIVDNGTDDLCAAVVRTVADVLPIRRVSAPVAGLCNARNCAVREARGDYICWTDDDTIVDRAWLVAYLRAFERHPEAAFFGGQILPRLDPPTPRWVQASRDCWQLKSVFAQRQFAAESPVAVDRDNTPWGANFAVRVEVQRSFEYDPRLGLSPMHNRSGDESDLLYRMLVQGHVGWWVPEAVVHHIIPVQRQTRAYLRSYFVRAGETAAYLRAMPNIGPRSGSETAAISRRMNRVITALGMLGCWGLFLIASLGQFRAATRFLARGSFYEGVMRHLHSSSRPAAPVPASRPDLRGAVQ